MGPINEGLTADQVKKYIRWIGVTARRLILIIHWRRFIWRLKTNLQSPEKTHLLG